MGWRWYVFGLRLADYFLTLPHRVWRLISWVFLIQTLHGRHRLLRRLAGVLMLLVDITPIPVLLESLLDFFKIATRPLSPAEQQLVKKIFGNSIPLQLIGMDDTSLPARKGRAKAYVLFHTVNFFGSISDNTLIHELTHVWQYRKHGSVYISEALWAQRWGGGYNYGGKDKLMIKINEGLSAFNFEQQADIVEEYYRVKHKMRPQWVGPDEDMMEVLEGYMRGVRK